MKMIETIAMLGAIGLFLIIGSLILIILWEIFK